MSLTVELTIAFALILAVYWYKYVKSVRNKLKWCKKYPGVPILGNAPEFSGGSTEHLAVLTKMIQFSGEQKCVHIEALFRSALIVTNYKLLEFILSSNSMDVLDKSETYKYLNSWLGTGLLTAPGIKWKKRRRIITPAFHIQILEQFVDLFELNSNIAAAKLEHEIDKDSFDVYPYITMCTLDIICETAMGVSINAQNNKNSDYVRSVKEMCRIIVDRTFKVNQMFDITYRFTKNYRIEKECIKILHSHTEGVINQRRKELESVKDNSNVTDYSTSKKKMAFLDLLLQATVDGKPLSDEDIREEVDTFMFAGHDTTSAAITFAIYLLAKYPEAQEKALEEQTSIFLVDKTRPTVYKDLQEMKYLENVIKETLRLYPSVPFYTRQLNNDVNYEGNIIPKDTAIVIFGYGIHRDKDNFKDPDKFDPSRFDRMTGLAPFSFLPFSAGARSCIGQKYAMLEMKTILSKILRKYELLPSIPPHEPLIAAETVMKSKNGVNISLKKRR